MAIDRYLRLRVMRGALNEQWKLEREQLKRQIDRCDDKKEDYIQKGVLLIELAQHTETVYKKATAEHKRKLVEAVSSNHRLRNGTIEFDYRKPFDLLASAHPKENWWSLAELYRTFFLENAYTPNEELSRLQAAV